MSLEQIYIPLDFPRVTPVITLPSLYHFSKTISSSPCLSRLRKQARSILMSTPVNCPSISCEVSHYNQSPEQSAPLLVLAGQQANCLQLTVSWNPAINNQHLKQCISVNPYHFRSPKLTKKAQPKLNHLNSCFLGNFRHGFSKF